MFNMLYCNLVEFFKVHSARGGGFCVFQWKGLRRLCSSDHDRVSVPPVVETQLAECTLSLSGFQCASSELRTALCRHTRRHGTEIHSYHSVMVIVLAHYTLHQRQYYISCVFDILWDGWLYLAPILCAERRQGVFC